MYKKRNTKRALMASLLSMVMCTSMLIGSTFAWFTDNATTNVNTIQSGTLDIQLLDANSAAANSLEGETLTFAKAPGAPAGEAVLFEPGAKYALQQVWLHNAGSLNAKYQVVVSGFDGDSVLAKNLDVIVDGQPVGTLDQMLLNEGIVKTGVIAPGEYQTFGTIELKMKESAGNDCQGKTLEGIAITVNATQAPVEYDSTTNQYDVNAEYDISVIVTEGEIRVPDGETLVIGGGNVNAYKLFEDSGDGVIIKNVNFEGTAVVWGAGGTITINGGTFKATAIVVVDAVTAPIVINGGTFDVESIDASTGGNVTINGGTFTCDPTGFVAPGKTAVDNGNGTWTVQ